VDSDFFAFQGGLNQVDPPLAIKPGYIIASRNYEPAIRGGYERVSGYERYDGRTAPSDAGYWVQNYDAATAVPAISDTVTGASSAATGHVLAVVETQAVTHINRALRSNDLTNASWTKLNASLSTDAMTNPLGTQTRTIIDDGANASHEVRQIIAKSAATQTWRTTWWVRADTIERVRIAVEDSAGGTNGAWASFNLTAGGVIATGVAGSGITVISQELTDLGGGWRRVAITASVDAGIANVQARLNLINELGAVTYAGIGKQLFFAGAQLELSPSADSSVFVLTDAEIRGNGTGYYVIGLVTGTFADNEDLDVSAVTQSRANGSASVNAAATDALDAEYRVLAREDARADITAVPGSGRVLGVVVYDGVVYAFRNNVGGTAAVMHKATTSGWTAIPASRKLRFTAGLAAGIVEGNTVTGLTSSATGVVRRVVVQSGTFAGDNAVGFLIVTGVTGAFVNAESLRVAGTTRATSNGADAAQTLAPNGHYEFRVHNFYGHTKSKRLYGVDGVNYAFEYQSGAEEFFCQIETGMTTDAPTHLAVHRDRLYLAFQGGSLQRSGNGDPAVWTVAAGAAELALGEEIVGLLEEVGQSLFVFGRNRTKYLAGSPPNEILENFATETGAIEWTVQRIAQGIYLDDIGITGLAVTDRFGNYISNSLSQLIQPLLQQLRQKAISSCIVREKGRYRLFFDDNQFISVAFNGTKLVGMTACDYGLAVRTVFSGEDAAGKEMIVFGADSGYVYQAERGTSFDGEPIEAFARLAFHFSGSPNLNKHYRRAQFNITCAGPTTMRIGVDYSFADPSAGQEPIKDLALAGGGAFWNLFNWNQANWGTPLVPAAIVDLNGEGLNMSFLFAHSSAEENAHRLDGVNLQWSRRRVNRGTTYG
jgi:hypothetical protein